MNKQKDEQGELLWIDEFEYPNGNKGFILKGPWHHAPGGYLRKKSKSRVNLENLRTKLYNIALERQELSKMDLRDMELCRALLIEAGCGAVMLSDVVKDYIKRNPAIVSVSVARALEWFRQDMKMKSRRPQTVSISIGIVEQYFKMFGVKETGQIKLETVKAFVYDPEVKSGRTKQGRRNKLSVFLAVCLQQNAVPGNFALEVSQPVDRKPLTRILNHGQLQALLNAAFEVGVSRNQHDGDRERGLMLPYIAVCMFSGIRPTECKRMNNWKHPDEGGYFDFENRLIGVREDVTKTRSRWVPMRENLYRILLWCKSHGLQPGFFSTRLFDKVRKQAGLVDATGEPWQWTGGHNDILRHSFASNRDAIDRDRKGLIHEMANSEGELIRSYLRQVHPVEAKKFDELLPSQLNASES